MTDLSALIKKLIDLGAAETSEIVGCTEKEIQQIESGIGAKLPLAYHEFLSRMGHSAGRLFVGTDIFFEHLPNLASGANRLLARDGKLFLPDRAFVFGMHQGYQFTFFILDGTEKPIVNGYMEKSGFYRVADSFSEFLSKAVEDTIHAEQTLSNRQKLVSDKRKKVFDN